MLTLDGVLPTMGSGSTSAGLGIGGGVLGGLLAGGIGGALTGGLVGNRGGWGGYGVPYGGPAANAVASSVVLDPAFQSLQQQVNGVSQQLSTGDIQDSIARTQDGIANLSTAVATGNFTTLNSINSLGRDLVTNIHQQDLQSLNSFNNLSTAMLQGFNGSAMQVQNVTNQIVAQGTAAAAANAAGFCDISRQMAECCCEIKGAIASDGNATRALINDLNVQSLRDQLAAANNKVSNNEQNQYLVSTILAHYPPVAPVV